MESEKEAREIKCLLHRMFGMWSDRPCDIAEQAPHNNMLVSTKHAPQALMYVSALI